MGASHRRLDFGYYRSQQKAGLLAAFTYFPCGLESEPPEGVTHSAGAVTVHLGGPVPQAVRRMPCLLHAGPRSRRLMPKGRSILLTICTVYTSAVQLLRPALAILSDQSCTAETCVLVRSL